MTRRVLRIITRLNVGGPATHVQLADAGLRTRGWETLLAFGSIDEGEAEMWLGGVPAVRLAALQKPLSPMADARALFQLARLVRSYRPHIIHTHLSKAGLLGRVAGAFTSRAARVHTFHGNVFDGYFGPRTARAILAVERVLGSRTDAIVALSEMQRSELLGYRIAPAHRIAVIPLGVDLQRFRSVDRRQARSALGIPVDVILVLAVGRMVPIKRLDRLVRAFSIAAVDQPRAHLYLVGDGPERPSVESLVNDLGLAQKVTFVGWSAETDRWYGAADVVALSSAREGTPLALIEAAAAGRPVVATGVGGVHDVVEDGVTGTIVPDWDETAFAVALGALLANAQLRDRMGFAAQEGASRFGAARLVDDLEQLYVALMARRPS